MLISSVSTLKLHLLVNCCLLFQNTKTINPRVIDEVVCQEENAFRHEIKYITLGSNSNWFLLSFSSCACF